MGYDVEGDRDAGTYFVTSIPDINTTNRSQSEVLRDAKVGSILIVAMSGVISEYLYFGDCQVLLF